MKLLESLIWYLLGLMVGIISTLFIISLPEDTTVIQTFIVLMIGVVFLALRHLLKEIDK